jgi:hypothetical protein
MAQQFTHTAKPATVPTSHPDQRYFKRTTEGDGCTGVFRSARQNAAELEIAFYGERFKQAVSVTAELSADQCEALARALLDAAHDLRTNTAAKLLAADEVAA